MRQGLAFPGGLKHKITEEDKNRIVKIAPTVTMPVLRERTGWSENSIRKVLKSAGVNCLSIPELRRL